MMHKFPDSKIHGQASWEDMNKEAGVENRFSKIKYKITKGAELLGVLSGVSSSRFESGVLTTDGDIANARTLATVTFARLGKIGQEYVDPATGLLTHDTMLDRSIFFGVKHDDEMVATARLVWTPDMTIDDTRMPLEQLDSKTVDMLRGLPPGSFAEFSSLAKRPGVGDVPPVQLFRDMFRYATENDIKYFTCGLEPHVSDKYEKYFGGVAKRLSEGTVTFPGIKGKQVPYLFELGDNIDEAIENQQSTGLKSPVLAMLIRNYFKSF